MRRRPSFPGLVRAELLKSSHQATTWLFVVVMFGGIGFSMLALLGAGNIKTEWQHVPAETAYTVLDVVSIVLSIGTGIVLLGLTARVIGQEYQNGTIRILLARGVGRLQLLFAKLTAVTIWALLILAAGLLAYLAFLFLTVQAWDGGTSRLTSLPAGFWADLRLRVLVLLVSEASCILLATGVAVTGRSLAIGMAVAMGWFPAENLATLAIILINRVTHQDFWLYIPDYLLGPNLNVLAGTLQHDHAARPAFATPLTPLSDAHIQLVILAFAVVFLVVSVVLTARRDVLE
ncbi:MAG TPA: ABC transporter permease [Candidatus Dormibacteraeota bacterium]